jgi:hypothetical protein
MDAARLINSLERTTEALAALVAGLPAADAAWRPEPGAWSIAEIAGHLLDEERLDFRPRIESTLKDPDAAWPATDPEASVEQHGYARRDLEEIWSAFLVERHSSLAWLRSLEEVDWTDAYAHPELGPLTAGDLLTSWAAHDVLHLRQITSRLFRILEVAAAPHSPRYAGPLT